MLAFLLLMLFFSSIKAFNFTMDEVRWGRDYFHPHRHNSFRMPLVSLELDTTVTDTVIFYEYPRIIIGGQQVTCCHKDAYGIDCEYLPVMVEYHKDSGEFTAFCNHHVPSDYKPTRQPNVNKKSIPAIPTEPPYITMELACES